MDRRTLRHRTIRKAAAMTHLPYLIGAFSVFVLVLAADALGSWLRLRAAKRLALRRQERLRARDTAAPAAPLATDLSR